MSVYYELNGKTVILTMEQYLDMNDDKEQELIAADKGYDINDPFCNLNFKEFKKLEIPEVELDELTDEQIQTIENEINKDGS